MPFQYCIDRERSLIILTASGVLTEQEVLELLEEIEVDPEFERGYAQLSDLREVTHLEISVAFVRQLASRQPAFPQEVRRAVVARASLVFGMTRMYQNLRGGEGNFRVFRDMDEALAWLEVER